MKLEIDYVKRILQIMENEPSAFCSMEALLKVLGNYDVLKLENHLLILRDMGAIECDENNMGFRWSVDGILSINEGIRYRITNDGYKILETLKNDTWVNNIVKSSKDIGIETLKNLPSLLIGAILK